MKERAGHEANESNGIRDVKSHESSRQHLMMLADGDCKVQGVTMNATDTTLSDTRRASN